MKNITKMRESLEYCRNISSRKIYIFDSSEKLPFRPFNKVSVNGVTYPAELVYETDNEIAIIADDESGFVGKEILFEI